MAWPEPKKRPLNKVYYTHFKKRLLFTAVFFSYKNGI
jgi:hypothetical protein